jgi:hypothetical protein
MYSICSHGGEFKSRCGAIAQLLGDPGLRPVAGAEESGDDTVEGAQLLLGALGALKQIAQIAGHARPLIGVTQKPAQDERLLEMIEEAQELGLVGRAAVAGM